MPTKGRQRVYQIVCTQIMSEIRSLSATVGIMIFFLLLLSHQTIISLNC